MQPGTPEHAAELERLASSLVPGLQAAANALAIVGRQNAALMAAVAFLAAELERRGGLDRAALAEAAIEGARDTMPAELDVAPLIRGLFGQGEEQVPGGPTRPGLRVIEGGKG